MTARTTGAVLALLLGLTGCAHVSVDTDGTRHVTGWVRVSLPPAVANPGAEALRVQTVGVAVVNSAVGRAVVLGYGDTTLAAVRNDAQVPARELLLPSRGEPR